MGAITRTFLVLFALCISNSMVAAEPEASPGEAGQPEAAAVSSDGQDEAESKRQKKQDPNRFRLLPIPIFITEPAIGNGLGVALALFHPVKGGKTGGDDERVASLESIGDISESRKAPPVVSGVAGAYTNNDTWFAAIGHSNNWNNDSIRYSGALGTARINSEIYLSNIPLSFTMETNLLYQELKFRLGNSDFMLGTALSYLDADNRFGIGLPDDLDEERFSTDLRNVGLSGKAAWDTRDNTTNPRRGQLVELSAWRYDDSIGGDYNYWLGKIKVLSFHKLSDKSTLGLRLDFSGVDERPPFFAVPFVKLRGIPALRYQNKIAGAVEVEGRYLIRPAWEVSAFAGLGYTSDDFAIYENPDSIYNFGIGGRYRIFESHNVWAGIDIARGPEDWNWYIQVGHPW
jgi:hypothetical protein